MMIFREQKSLYYYVDTLLFFREEIIQIDYKLKEQRKKNGKFQHF